MYHVQMRQIRLIEKAEELRAAKRDRFKDATTQYVDLIEKRESLRQRKEIDSITQTPKARVPRRGDRRGQGNGWRAL